jgi:hypothetical protein
MMMTSILLAKFGRYLLIPALILIYTLGVGFTGYRWGKAGAELAYAEAQLDLSQKIRRADEQIERKNPSTAPNEAILERLRKYAVHRDY